MTCHTYTQQPTTYISHPTPYTPHPTPHNKANTSRDMSHLNTYTPTPHTLHSTPHNQSNKATTSNDPSLPHPTAYTLHPTPHTLHTPNHTIDPTNSRPHIRSHTHNLHPTPYTPHPIPHNESDRNRVAKTHRMPCKLQVIFRKRATNYRALLRKMTYKDKAMALRHSVPRNQSDKAKHFHDVSLVLPRTHSTPHHTA